MEKGDRVEHGEWCRADEMSGDLRSQMDEGGEKAWIVHNA